MGIVLLFSWNRQSSNKRNLDLNIYEKVLNLSKKQRENNNLYLIGDL